MSWVVQNGTYLTTAFHPPTSFGTDPLVVWNLMGLVNDSQRCSIGQWFLSWFAHQHCSLRDCTQGDWMTLEERREKTCNCSKNAHHSTDYRDWQIAREVI